MMRAASELRRTRHQRRFATGTVLCPGIDTDDFAQKCRAPIFPNQWNHWRLYKSTRDNVSKGETETQARAFVQLHAPKYEGGSIPLAAISVDEPPPWVQSQAVIARREDCDPVPVLGSSPHEPAFRAVYVRFVYRGSAGTMPWAVRKVSSLGFGSPCPIDADWILDRVYAPDAANVPSETEDPIIPEPYTKDLPKLPPLPSGVQLGLVIGGATALAVAIGYAIRSVR